MFLMSKSERFFLESWSPVREGKVSLGIKGVYSSSAIAVTVGLLVWKVTIGYRRPDPVDEVKTLPHGEPVVP